MNALVISDLHAHDAWPFSAPLPNGRPSRFQDLLDVLSQVRRWLDEYQPENLLILGDLTHRRHFIKFALYNDLMMAIHALTERVKQTVILVGNHDLEDDETHSLYPFSFLPNTIVVDRPRVVTLADGQEAVYAIPYMADPRAMTGAVEQAPADMPLLAHYAAEGVKLETDYWLDFPLKIGEVARFPLVLFGHIHKPSEQLERRVWYVGAPLHFDFGDDGPRRCLLIDDGHHPASDFPSGTRVGDMFIHELPTTFPVFRTARWPRLPQAPAESGYLRILEVPAPKLEEAKAWAAKLGWRACLPLEQALPQEVRAAIESGLVVDEALLRDYVGRRCPELTEEDREALVLEGAALLREARG